MSRADRASGPPFAFAGAAHFFAAETGQVSLAMFEPDRRVE
jgi:hypothetical protein